MFKIVAAFIALAVFQGACATPLLFVRNTSVQLDGLNSGGPMAGTTQTVSKPTSAYGVDTPVIRARADDSSSQEDNIVDVQSENDDPQSSATGVSLKDSLTDGLPVVGGGGTSGSDTGLGDATGAFSGLGGSPSELGLVSPSPVDGLVPGLRVPISGSSGDSELPGVGGILSGSTGVLGALTGGLLRKDVQVDDTKSA